MAAVEGIAFVHTEPSEAAAVEGTEVAVGRCSPLFRPSCRKLGLECMLPLVFLK